ncbi:MAG: hypothetical protein HeimC3_30690 [Candidatus Heimdallarchaeota archaeon LC_3]|nr:MAG: hypothetical protein HeimC3_30690 [Candidatus Heimdallarchaeota archaeon LC_3]
MKMEKISIFSKEAIEHQSKVEAGQRLMRNLRVNYRNELSPNEVKKLNNRIKSKDKSWT